MRGFNLFRSYLTISRTKELRDRTKFHVMTISTLGGLYAFYETYGTRLAERYGTAKRSVLGLMGK